MDEWMVVSNVFFLNFHPEAWGNDGGFDEYFSSGLVQPPTSAWMDVSFEMTRGLFAMQTSEQPLYHRLAFPRHRRNDGGVRNEWACAHDRNETSKVCKFVHVVLINTCLCPSSLFDDSMDSHMNTSIHHLGNLHKHSFLLHQVKSAKTAPT